MFKLNIENRKNTNKKGTTDLKDGQFSNSFVHRIMHFYLQNFKSYQLMYKYEIKIFSHRITSCQNIHTVFHD